MSEQTGAVFAVDANQALYVTYAQLDAFGNLAEAFGRTPTVAGGELDLAVLESLRDALVRARGLDVQPTEGHRLTPAQAEYLNLLHLQGALRARLPLRLHRTCTACGTKKLVNPARPKASGTEKAGDIVNAMVGLANLAADPLGGFLNIMSDMGSKKSAAAVLCEYCEGFEFELPAVTFCPNCKALRTEAVLVTCPDCHTDFAAADAQPQWVPLGDAGDAARVADVRRTVGAACARLASGVYPAQRAALLDALTADDVPHTLFRSSRPGDTTRSTVLLATSRQLVFVRETMAGKANVDHVAWADITGVRLFVPAKTSRDATIMLERGTGQPLSFTRIGEVGQNLAADGTVDISAIAHNLASLAGRPLLGPPDPQVPPQAAPTATIPAPSPNLVPSIPAHATPFAPAPPAPAHPGPLATAPPPPAPAQPGPASPAPVDPFRPPSEQAGWYPDPWHQARIRWWDGTAWTANLNA